MLRASTWQDYQTDEEIVKEGEMDDRFYILVNGSCWWSATAALGQLDAGDCFGETSYVRGAKPHRDDQGAQRRCRVLRVSSTLLEQVSAACQLRFNRVFLRSLISRLQSPN